MSAASSRHLEIGRQDADDADVRNRPGPGVETQRASDGSRMRTIAAHPQSVADESDAGRSPHVVLWHEVAAQRDAHAQHAKEGVVDGPAPHAFRPFLGDVARPCIHRRHRLERRRSRVPHLHVGLVEHRLGLAQRSARCSQQADGDETIRIGVRQRPEEHAVERREERRGGAEAERQHEDGRQREAGRRRHERHVKCASCRSASHHSAIQTRRIDSRVCSRLPRRRRAAAWSTRSCSARIATCASSSSRISSSDGRLRNISISSQCCHWIDMSGIERGPEDRDDEDQRERKQSPVHDHGSNACTS